MNCDSSDQQGIMANKASLMKMIQVIRGYAEITNRRPAPRPPVLYLMALREQQPAYPSKPQRLTTVWENVSDAPLPIKITHVKRGCCDLPVTIG